VQERHWAVVVAICGLAIAEPGTQPMKPAFQCLLLALLLTGCGTPKQRFAAINPPSDKALVYLMWERQFFRAAGVAIHINDEPRAVLHTSGYFPLILDPGFVSLGYSFVAHPMVPFRVAKEGMLQMSLKPGQTYYVAYRPWAGTWYPQLVQLQPAVAICEITNYTIGKEWIKK
jgi:hypothetical protein